MGTGDGTRTARLYRPRELWIQVTRLLRSSVKRVGIAIVGASISTNEPQRDPHLRSEDFSDAQEFPGTFESTPQ